MVYIIVMKKLLFLIFVFSLVLFSCDLDDTGTRSPQSRLRNFWAQDTSNNSFYRVNASLVYSGVHCEIWAEIGSGITVADAWTIANVYDYNIYQKMINAFSSPIIYNGKSFPNAMAFADWAGGGNQKLCILMLDIKDKYQKGVNESYVAGYFQPTDLLSNYPNSNLYDMIYIDTYPGFSSDSGNVYRTLAHEMQHLINFVTSIACRLADNTVNQMDTWIDEGLSSSAEWVYDGHSVNRIDWFKNNGVFNSSNVKVMSGLIDKGNNFFVWGNRVAKNIAEQQSDANKSIYANQDDYSTVYLFFQWLRLQSGGTSIYKNIIVSPYSDYRAVVNSISGYSDWDTLLKTWLAANYINASSGPYGYKDDSAFDGMKAPTAPSGTTTLSLYQGEGVYSIANTEPSISGQGANIKNVYLTTTTLSDTFIAGALLTYNKNTVFIDPVTKQPIPPETGTTTGVASSITTTAAQSVSGGRSVTARSIGPFPIGAGDLLRSFGAERAEPLVIEFSKDGNDGD